MNVHFAFPVLMVTLFAGLNAPGKALAAVGTTACATLNEADAVALLGGPLGATSKTDTAATSENGNDHQTACGYFPKGYDLEKAAGPPERGILITLHAMSNGEAAKQYYDGVLNMLKGMPESQGGGSKIAAVTGIGEGAYAKPIFLANSSSKIVTLTFLKGNVMADVQVWTKAGSVNEIAKGAARKVVSRLP